MEAACLRQTELPHASRLFADFTYHFDRVSNFYRYPPRDLDAIRRAAAAVHYPEERRTAMVEALRRQNGDSPALARFAQPDTVAIVTGQQVGLFSGPAYTMYKALTAARIATHLTEQGIPAVPVFWLATEDHDLAEVDHAWAFGGDHQPVALRASARSDGQRPVGGIQLDSAPVAELHELLGSFPFGNDVSDIVAEAYRPGVTLGESFRRLVQSLLHKFDLLYLDPLAEDVRRIGGPFLLNAISVAPDLKRDLLARNAELQEAGYHTQVHVEPNSSLFFVLDGGRRISLKKQNGYYVSKERRYTPDELAAAAEHLSPNALLRPVMQDYLLPTAMYFGGPAELAYLAQAEVLYRTLLGRMPVVEHRAGFTLLDARAKKLMERYRLGWPEVFEGESGLRDAIARRLIPSELQRVFEETTHSVESSLFRLGHELSRFDPTLVSALEKGRAKMLYQLSKLQKKSEREALRRNTRACEEARYLSGLLYPNKHLQERLYSILPFIAKHGFDLLDQLYQQINLICPDHQLVMI
jgi:bacillithiol biosynthesis cysteine-adding enzyme BshC